MLTVRVGKARMARRRSAKGWLLLCVSVSIPVFLLVTLILQKHSNPFEADWRALYGDFDPSNRITKAPPKLAGTCHVKRTCPEDNFSFYIQSGAANVVPPKICVQNNLVLGTALSNAGTGINVVIISGHTGEVIKTDHFDMYSGDVNLLVDFLKGIEHGTVVLMASYDEPSSKLNDDAKKLIAELGSAAVHSLGFRDNWVFVGGKGAEVKSSFEKHVRNNREKNKYENWPELIDIQGCIPKYME